MSGTATTTTRDHPITVVAAECEDLITSVAEQSTWSMSDEETRSTLTRLTRLAAEVAELELRVAAHAETNRVGDETGATSTAAWWATTTNQTKPAAHRLVKLATALDTDRHQPLRAALAAGEVLRATDTALTESGASSTSAPTSRGHVVVTAPRASAHARGLRQSIGRSAVTRS